MKKVFTAIVIVLSATSAIAGGSQQKATEADKDLLCSMVSSYLEENQVEAGLDEGDCYRSQKVTSKVVSEGVVLVKGELTFNGPDRPSYKMTCSFAYILDEVVQSVTCK